MKNWKQWLFILALGAVCIASPAGAQSVGFNVLHTFSAPAPNGDNDDGSYSQAGLILSGNILYGTANNGGTSGNGVVFKLNSDGSGFTVLHDFSIGSLPQFTNQDGALPDGMLVLWNGTLYGTTSDAGFYGPGTIFRLNPDGTGFVNLHNFQPISGVSETNADGAFCQSGLVPLNGRLYGTAGSGGAAGQGTVFGLNPDGSGFSVIHQFSAPDPVYGTNSDGAVPESGLAVAGGALFGSAETGGAFGNGVLYRLNPDGSGFEILYNFIGNGDGIVPCGNLTISGNTIYGTTVDGGAYGSGSVFSIQTDGSDFVTLYSFGGGDDGGYPYGGMVLNGNMLYGTTENFGPYNAGGIFLIGIDGSGFTTLYSFTDGDDGSNPLAGLVMAGNSLYGTCAYGGPGSDGTIFSFSLVQLPSLSIALTNGDVLVSWPASTSNYSLQTSTDLSSSSSWQTLSNLAASNCVLFTNLLPSAYFRLQQN